jgi:hypothetical protein
MCCVHRLRFPHPPAEAQPNILQIQRVGINFDSEEARDTFTKGLQTKKNVSVLRSDEPVLGV